MNTELAPYVGAVAVVSAAAITWAARVAPLVARPTEPEPASFTEPEPGTRWLRCDTTTCGHLTRPHVPQPDGTWVCTVCADSKGEPQ
ncbi:hypothetical protein ACIQGT_40270 [Streptomyces sp. NPDC093108]|uniref:hypothetical protein n=1 Tax=Streptomyces sp. NPDC093108 TaxID=3366030 RepID=UPI0038167170